MKLNFVTNAHRQQDGKNYETQHTTYSSSEMDGGSGYLFHLSSFFEVNESFCSLQIKRLNINIWISENDDFRMMLS